ncbi:Ig-like domain-containing protein [Aeromonas hydrophila]
MTTQTIQLFLVDSKEIRQELSLNKGSKGTIPKIRATPDAKFILADKETGRAPENITVRRVGKNLHLFIEGDEVAHPTVIIEDFFEYNCELLGMAEDSGYYAYVSSNGDDNVAGVLALQDGESSALALGGEMLPGDVDRTSFGLVPWIVGGGLVAGAGALSSGSGGSKGGNVLAPAPQEKPNAPVINRITDAVGAKQGDLTVGDITDDQRPTLSGTAAANAKVEIFDNGIFIGSTVVDGNGNWSFTPTQPLAEGSHSLTARSINQAGQASEFSPVWNITVDISASGKPGSDIQIDGSHGPIVNGGTTNDNKPTFKGEGTPGDTIIIIDEKTGEVIGETKVDENGKWELIPNPPLSDGEHEIVVIIKDLSGNQSEKSDPIVIIVDTQVPAAPVIAQILDNVGVKQGELSVGDITDDQQPTLIGTAKANALVEIFDNGTKFGETRADAKGNWSFTPDQPLSEGPHSFTTRATDLAGNVSELSPVWPITVDITAPGKPGIDGQGPGLHEIDGGNGPIGQGDITNDNKPTFKGEGTPGDTIIISDEKNDEVIGETKVDAGGKWELVPNPPLKDGEHEIVVIIQDPAGNQSEKSDPITIVVDTQTPAAPVIASIIDAVGLRQGELTAGDVTDDTRPTFSGTAKAKSLVEIFDNGVKIGETRADANGNWSFIPGQDLGEGLHSFTARTTDLAGSVSAQSPAWAIEVDTTPPDQPDINGSGAGITEIIDDFGSVTGPISQGGITDDHQPTLKGHGGQGDTIIILVNGQEIGKAKVDSEGAWTFKVAVPLEDGAHAFTVIVQDRAGNQSLPSPPWNVTITTFQPAYPWVLTDNVGESQGPLNPGDFTDDASPGMWGYAPPGTIIHIFVGDTLLGTTTPNSNTRVWKFLTPVQLPDGQHTFSVTFTDPVGITSPKDSKTVTIDTSTVTPMIESIFDNVGVNKGELTVGAATDDQQPTISGTTEAKALVEIFDHGARIGEARADDNGNWSFTPDKPLADGSHTFTTRAIDLAGNVSKYSPAWEIVIDTAAPEKPGIDGKGPGISEVIDDVGNIQGPIANGGVTDDNTPTLKGQGTPGDTIIIMDNNQRLGEVNVGADGRWEFTSKTPLSDGVHAISVIIQDSAGNVSEPSDPWVVNVDTDEVPKQVVSLTHMGKDSGQDANDYVTQNGSYGRLMFGSLSAGLKAGQALMISTDGGKSWSEALVNGTDWVAQDLVAHDGDWSILTRIKGTDGTYGAITEQNVVLDNTASRAPSSIKLNGTNLNIAFDPSNVAEGDRIAVVADGGAHRFEHTLTAQDIAAGNVTLYVGSISSASAALVDLAGNLSDYVNTASRPKTNAVLTGDVAEVYGTNYDNVFSISDVSVLQNIRLIEGNDGVDSLKLTGANQVLDFSAWQGRFSSIEVIDITGSGDNTVRISLGDVLELGHHNYFMDENTVQLAIRGNTGDTVELSDLLPNGMDVGDWEITGSVTVAGYQYEVYRHTEMAADLLVQHGVQVQF